MKRVLKTLVTLLALTGTLLVLGGGAASADPNWQPVTKTSKFHCSPEYLHPDYNVTVQTCVVVNGNSTQAVAIVANRDFTAVSLAAPDVALYVNGPISYDRHCDPSVLNGGYNRACFGPTQTRPCSATVQALTYVSVAGWSITTVSPAWKMCT